MASINWTQGQLITMNSGDTATCTGGLTPGQLYSLFFYNSAQNDKNAGVSVIWSNSQPPVTVTVPGTTGNLGLAALCFVSGDDTNTVSASLSSAVSGQQIQAFIGSVSMPINTSGINNEALPLDGQMHAFTKFTRYYAVPQSHWYAGTIQSDINQFISVQFQTSRAVVNVVNALVDPSPVISYCGKSQSQVTVQTVPNQTLPWNFQGNGQQMVWINADSTQNSQTAQIAVQSLSGAFKAFAEAVV